jgi:hypothetical protein
MTSVRLQNSEIKSRPVFTDPIRLTVKPPNLNVDPIIVVLAGVREGDFSAMWKVLPLESANTTVSSVPILNVIWLFTCGRL